MRGSAKPPAPPRVPAAQRRAALALEDRLVHRNARSLPKRPEQSRHMTPRAKRRPAALEKNNVSARGPVPTRVRGRAALRSARRSAEKTWSSRSPANPPNYGSRSRCDPRHENNLAKLGATSRSLGETNLRRAGAGPLGRAPPGHHPPRIPGSPAIPPSGASRGRAPASSPNCRGRVIGSAASRCVWLCRQPARSPQPRSLGACSAHTADRLSALVDHHVGDGDEESEGHQRDGDGDGAHEQHGWDGPFRKIVKGRQSEVRASTLCPGFLQRSHHSPCPTLQDAALQTATERRRNAPLGQRNSGIRVVEPQLVQEPFYRSTDKPESEPAPRPRPCAAPPGSQPAADSSAVARASSGCVARTPSPRAPTRRAPSPGCRRGR